jgi:C_GCAxxG_C_C family probable redox protein
MAKRDEAVAKFRSGLNCAQAILRTYGGGEGLAAHHALRLASGFGAGMRRGDTCGAVTGAVLTLGLRAGFDDPSDAAGKARIGEVVVELFRRFEGEHGAVACRALLGCDLDQARARGLLQQRCPAFVETAARILDELVPGTAGAGEVP